MKPITVLVTGAGTATCQSVIKGLRSQNEFQVTLVTVDMQAASAGRWFSDRFYCIPGAREPAFLPTMLDLCRQNHVDLLIPIVDYEFETFAKARPQFEELGCCVAISPPAVIHRCTDKWEMYQFLKQERFPTPATWLPQGITAEDLPYPLFVKPRLLGRGTLDTYQARSPEELRCFLALVRNPIVQEALAGQECTIDVLCDFAGRGLNGVVRERIETKAGVSYKGRTVRDPALLDQAVKLAEKLGIIGPANIQCFKHEGRVHFLEVNPRYSGALALSLAAGFNSPLWLMKLARHEPIEPAIGCYRENICMLRYWQEVFVGPGGERLPSLRIEQAGEP